MFGNTFTGWHLVIILFLVLLLFGAPKLPGLAKSLGQSMRILKKEVRSDDAAGPAESAESTLTPEQEAEKARAEAEAAKRELEALKAQQAAERARKGDAEN